MAVAALVLRLICRKQRTIATAALASKPPPLLCLRIFRSALTAYSGISQDYGFSARMVPIRIRLLGNDLAVFTGNKVVCHTSALFFEALGRRRVLERVLPWREALDPGFLRFCFIEM